eukprot:c13974_g1_i1.p2 GENE.c13974_g1_i1~~c13974_g1_i1.p2  ORF type:complete len:115 (-),score=31.13 c13974_g1_i1:165-509(-)
MSIVFCLVARVNSGRGATEPLAPLYVLLNGLIIVLVELLFTDQLIARLSKFGMYGRFPEVQLEWAWRHRSPTLPYELIVMILLVSTQVATTVFGVLCVKHDSQGNVFFGSCFSN